MKRAGIILLFTAAVWFVWAETGHEAEWISSESPIEIVQSFRIDSMCSKNIVAIQPYMLTDDYRSERHFYEKLKVYFERAKQRGYIQKNTVVVLPEYIGTWLVVSGEKKSVTKAETINSAMMVMVLSNPFDFIQSMFNRQDEDDAFAAALFRMKAENMASQFSSAFKQLASEYQVTISAGSIVLPGPSIKDNRIQVNVKEPLYNVSFIFTPAGIEQQVVKKSFPISSELPFIKPWPIEELPSFDLPIGRAVVLVCADSWYPESYNKLNELNPEIVLVGSYCSVNKAMREPWRGYDGGRQPADVESTDVQKITEQEAWVKYALPGRIKSTHARVGVNIFLRGDLWDLGSDGYPLLVADGNLIEVKKSEKAGIYNICF